MLLVIYQKQRIIVRIGYSKLENIYFKNFIKMSELVPDKMKVAELRAALSERSLDTKGTKPVLVARLVEAIEAEKAAAEAEKKAAEPEPEAGVGSEEEAGDATESMEVEEKDEERMIK